MLEPFQQSNGNYEESFQLSNVMAEVLSSAPLSGNSIDVPVQGVPKYISFDSTVLSQVLELFLNERYSPISGFCTKGLLVNDRGPISNENGSCSWKSLEEATTSLLSHG